MDNEIQNKHKTGEENSGNKEITENDSGGIGG